MVQGHLEAANVNMTDELAQKKMEIKLNKTNKALQLRKATTTNLRRRNPLRNQINLMKLMM